MFSRKFLITVLTLLLSTWLLLIKVIGSDIWLSAVSMVTAGYLGANTLSHYGDSLKYRIRKTRKENEKFNEEDI